MISVIYWLQILGIQLTLCVWNEGCFQVYVTLIPVHRKMQPHLRFFRDRYWSKSTSWVFEQAQAFNPLWGESCGTDSKHISRFHDSWADKNFQKIIFIERFHQEFGARFGLASSICPKVLSFMKHNYPFYLKY